MRPGRHDTPDGLASYHWELDFTVTEVTGEVARAVMPVSDKIRNLHGTVHAGAMIWMADVLATILAMGKTAVEPDQPGFPLVVNLTSSFLRNVGEGELTAESRWVRRGRRLSVIRTTVSSGDKLLVEVTTTHTPS